MKRVIAYIAIFGLLSGLIPPLSFAYANEFNPNFIISDEELQNSSSMNRADIQAFLEAYGGALSFMKLPDKNGVARPAEYIISQAASEHRINPKYILVKLQKEQSLITEESPSQKQLDGAAGYGITDSCGWSCETYLNNVGFGKQVDAAAGIMRWYYDHADSEHWIKKPLTTYNVDGRTVRPLNLATAFLYTYTPHIEGNENFWRLWQKWFSQVYPDGTLVKAADSHTIYLIHSGKKRAFTSMTALQSRYDLKMVVIAPASELNRYETGSPIRLPNYAVLKNGNNYYLTDYTALRPFASSETVRSLGYHPDEIIEVSDSDIAGFEQGAVIKANETNPLGRIVKIRENNALYLLRDGLRNPIYDETIAAMTYPHLSIELVGAAELAEYDRQGPPVLLKDGTLFGISGSNKIYTVENGKKRHIANERVFNGLGYSWSNIVWINEFAGMAHANGEAVYVEESEDSITTAGTAPSLPSAAESVATEQEDGQSGDLASKMFRTAPDKTVFIGKSMETDMDAYIITDAQTGEIIAGKNVDSMRPLASLVKPITAYQLMKEGLSQTATVSYDAARHKSIYHRYRVAQGERVLNSDLLYAMLVSSLNTPARMLVSSVETDEQSFVSRINSQLALWGYQNTGIADPAGVEVSNESTAREYASIFARVISNADVSSYMKTRNYSYDEKKDLDGMPRHFDEHTNDLLKKESSLPFTIAESKTGYLHESGANLAMRIIRRSDARSFIIVMLGYADSASRFAEFERLARWAVELN